MSCECVDLTVKHSLKIKLLFQIQAKEERKAKELEIWVMLRLTS